MTIGVVGCGFVAQYHMPFIVKHKSAERVVVTDVDRGKAMRLARRFGVEAAPNIAAMLRTHRPRVVHILTPPRTHAALAAEAIDAGCHVFVEKPMAVSLQEADAMNTAARRRGVKLCVGHSRLYSPVMIKARDLVARGKLGRLLHVDVSYNFDMASIFPQGTDSNQKLDWIQGLPGGVIFDLLPHPVSILLEFLNEPVHICATGKYNGTRFVDGLSEMRAFFTGDQPTGLLSVSLGASPDGLTVHLYGTKMSIHAQLANMTLVTCKKRRVPRAVARSLENLEYAAQLVSCTLLGGLNLALGRVAPPDGIASIIDHFYRSIEDDSEPPVSAERGSAVVKICTELLKQVTENDKPTHLSIMAAGMTD